MKMKMNREKRFTWACVRKERAQRAFCWKQKQKPKTTNERFPHKKKTIHIKKAHAITIPAPHAPKLPPTLSHSPLLPSFPKKSNKNYSILNLTQQKTLKKPQKRNKKKLTHIVIMLPVPHSIPLSLSLPLYPSLSLAKLIFLAAFFNA